MYPPKPTKDPYELLNNLYFSLSRACSDHWSGEATVVPNGTGGYVATLQIARSLDDSSWEAASKYMRKYARASHWKVHELGRKQGFVELRLEHEVPKPKKKPHRGERPASRKSEECKPQDQGAQQTPPPSTTS